MASIITLNLLNHLLRYIIDLHAKIIFECFLKYPKIATTQKSIHIIPISELEQLHYYQTIITLLNLYLPSILETHPLETWSILEMSHGLAPECASSTIFCLVESGKGRPLTNTPPSWFTPLCPVHSHTAN